MSYPQVRSYPRRRYRTQRHSRAQRSSKRTWTLIIVCALTAAFVECPQEWRPSGYTAAGGLLGSWLATVAYLYIRITRGRVRLARSAEWQFRLAQCVRCGHNRSWVIVAQPTAIRCRCQTCHTRSWARAQAPEAERFAGAYRRWQRCKSILRFLAPTLTTKLGLTVQAESVNLWSKTRRERIPAALASAVFERAHGRCEQCGNSNHLEIDHVVPVSRGGATSAQNLQTLCRPCNRKKGAKT